MEPKVPNHVSLRAVRVDASNKAEKDRIAAGGNPDHKLYELYFLMTEEAKIALKDTPVALEIVPKEGKRMTYTQFLDEPMMRVSIRCDTTFNLTVASAPQFNTTTTVDYVQIKLN